MKLVIALVALIGISFSAPTLNLEQDILDFIELIPLEDIKIIVDKHLRNDKEFQAAVQFLQSDEWADLMENLFKTGETEDTKKYLYDAGIDVDFIASILEELLSEVNIKSHHNKKSVKKLLEEVSSIMPYQELLKLYTEKMSKSKAFQDFIDKLTSERFHKLVEKLLATEETQQVLDAIESLELNIRNHIKMAYAFIGWKASENLYRPNDISN